MTESPAHTSTAHVDTARGGRYGKQLVSHLGRRLSTEWDDASSTGSIRRDDTVCTIEATPTQLVLRAEVRPAADQPDEALAQLEDVVGRHLARFGTRDELIVAWERADGTHGRTFRHTDETPEEHTGPG